MRSWGEEKQEGREGKSCAPDGLADDNEDHSQDERKGASLHAREEVLLDGVLGDGSAESEEVVLDVEEVG